MATVTKGKTFISGETVEPADMHQLVDSATVTNIVDADISASAAIEASKLAATLDLSSKTITLPDSNIGTSKIADAAVTAAKLDGAQTGSAPIFGARAWVVFNGTVNANIGGTYTRTGTTVEVTTTVPHGHKVNHRVELDFTTGAAADGEFTVTSVISDTKFTVTHGTSGSTSGNVTLVRRLINASGNVSNVVRGGTGLFWINFTTDLPSANAAVVASSNTGSVAALVPSIGQSRAYISCRDTAWALDDPSLVSVVVFG